MQGSGENAKFTLVWGVSLTPLCQFTIRANCTPKTKVNLTVKWGENIQFFYSCSGRKLAPFWGMQSFIQRGVKQASQTGESIFMSAHEVKKGGCSHDFLKTALCNCYNSECILLILLSVYSLLFSTLLSSSLLCCCVLYFLNAARDHKILMLLSWKVNCSRNQIMLPPFRVELPQSLCLCVCVQYDVVDVVFFSFFASD